MAISWVLHFRMKIEPLTQIDPIDPNQILPSRDPKISWWQWTIPQGPASDSASLGDPTLPTRAGYDIFTNGKGLYKVLPSPVHINHKRNHGFLLGINTHLWDVSGVMIGGWVLYLTRNPTATWFSAVPTARYAPWTKPNLSVALRMRCGGSLSLVPPDGQKNCWFNMGKFHTQFRSMIFAVNGFPDFTVFDYPRVFHERKWTKVDPVSWKDCWWWFLTQTLVDIGWIHTHNSQYALRKSSVTKIYKNNKT